MLLMMGDYPLCRHLHAYKFLSKTLYYIILMYIEYKVQGSYIIYSLITYLQF